MHDPSSSRIPALLLSAIGALAALWAPGAAAQDEPVGDGGADQWRLGVMGSISDDAYAGADASTSVLPLIYFDGRWLFFHATEGGVHLYRSGAFTLDALLSLGGQEMDPDDLGRRELTAAGVDRDRLDDRDRSYYAGLAGTWRTPFGVLGAEAQTDISGNAEGERYHGYYAYPWQAGDLRITPSLGVTYLSGRITDYYFGVDTDESLDGSYAYYPDAALVPGAGLDLAYALNRDWAVYAGLEYQHYPDEIADSPLIEDDHAVSFHSGISYSF